MSSAAGGAGDHRGAGTCCQTLHHAGTSAPAQCSLWQPQPMASGAGQRKEMLLQLGAACAAQHVQIGAPGLFSLDVTSKEMQSSGLLVTQAGNRCNPTALLLPQKAQRRNQPRLLGNDRLLPDGARLSTAAAPQASSFTPSREKPKASLQTAPGFG